MALNFKRIWNGLQVKPITSTAADTKGELEVIDSTGKLQLHNGTSVSPVVTESHASQGANRLQNKDLDASSTKIVDPSDTAKKVAVDVSGATTATTTTLDFNQTANRTITIPDATDTLVARDTTDTLTNKTLTSPVVNSADLSLDDTNSAFALNVDSTSGLTANRTLTVDVNDADRTIDLSGNLTVSTAVTLDGTEVKGPASATDEAIVRFDGTTGKLVKSGTGTISAAGAVAGLTDLTVDNVNINGNIIAATSGNLFLDAPSSTDEIIIEKGIRANNFLRFTSTSVATTGNIDALNTTNRSQIIFTGAGAVTLRGIAGGQSGYVLFIVNTTGSDLTIVNEYAGATATDRILTGTGADIVVKDNASALFQYNGVDSRWNVTSGSGIEVLDEGSSVSTGVSKIDFIGTNVSATLASPGRVSVTVSGGAGGDFDVISKEGLQNFVKSSAVLTPVNGAPSSSQFRSDITGRASITDISADLKPYIGVERVITQNAYKIYGEVGSSDQPVYGVSSDPYNLIRFVGNISNVVDSNGSYIQLGSDNDYVEVVFYGTGLNVLTIADSTARDLRATLDGGSEGGDLIPTEGSEPVARNYNRNRIINVTSAQTLGVHTVKLRRNSGNIAIYGFEILNEATTLKVNSGTSYISGGEVISASPQSVAYETTFEDIQLDGSTTGSLGVRGARVLAYLNSSGVVKKVATAVNSASANLSSASHIYEDIIQTRHWREFGSHITSPTSDDFSTLTGSVSSRAFSLDDNSTILIGSSVSTASSAANELLYIENTNSYIELSFYGTGLDVIENDGYTSALSTHTVTVDGSSIGTITGTAVNVDKVRKIVSGLPLGTHVVKINRDAGSGTTGGFGLKQFIIYGPKKPTLPADSIEIADYCINATYVANTVAGLQTIGTGVIRKHITNREAVFVNGTTGTADWDLSGPAPTTYIGGYPMFSDRLNSYVEYTFFGTGFEFRFEATTARTTNALISLNGTALTAANFGTATFSTYGTGVSFNSGTGALDQLNGSSIPGAGFTVSGLPLAKYTVKINIGTASEYMNVGVLDIITPIYVPNFNVKTDAPRSASVGNQSIMDLRKFSPVKSESPKKAWAQAFGIISGPTTTSGVFVLMPDMTCNINLTKASAVEINYSAYTSTSAGGTTNKTQIYIDGVPVGKEKGSEISTSNEGIGHNDSFIVQLSAGVHVVQLFWTTNAGTMTAITTRRSMSVKEI